MKKILLFLVSLLPMLASAATIKAGDWFKDYTPEGYLMQFVASTNVYTDELCCTCASPNPGYSSCISAAYGKVTIPSYAKGLKVIRIQTQAFYDLDGMTELVIPSTVEYMGTNILQDCYYVSKVTCNATIPPTVSGSGFIFGYSTEEDGTLYVPKGCVSKYQSANGWKRFKTIKEIGADDGMEINETNFPDANFRNWLKSQSFGSDGVLTDAEIANVTSINVSGTSSSPGNITNLEGIEFFTALTELTCSYNQITSLDVSKNTKLNTLWCHQNQIKGTKMNALVKSLPTVSSGIMNVIYNENEGNVMTTTQVAAAKAKGWTPQYYTGSEWQGYAGSEPEPEPEGSIITIGDAATSSSNRMPLGSYDKNSTTQFLYTPSEIGKGGKITDIAFKIAASSSHSTSEMKIYLGHKSGTFSGTDDYVNSSNLTLVYSGSPTVGKSTGWETYAFNQGSFTYNGTDNLVVVVTRKSDNYNTDLKYYCFTSSGYGLRRGNDNNSEYGDVSNTSYSYSTTTERPAIQMVIDVNELEKCAMPTISYANGKLQFSCETEGAEIVSKVTCSDSGEYEGMDVPLTAAYTVTAYAKKSGYADSDVATKEINVGGAAGGIRGDVNGDGTVSMPDAMFIVQKILNGKFPDENLQAPRVRFGFYETVAGYSVTINNINVDYNLTIGTDAIGSALNTTATNPTWDAADGEYSAVQPDETNTNPMLIKLDYTLTSKDGSGENIVIRNAEVEVPAETLKWQYNQDYTYILKISDNPDWKPTMKLAELFPTTLDKVEITGNNVTR